MVQVRSDAPSAQPIIALPVCAVESIDELSRADREALAATFPLATLGDAVLGAPAGLDLPEGIDNPPTQGCARWPSHFLLRWQRGEESGYVRGRCKATNLCPYCQRLYVRETVEMLRLDALENAPTIWTVLTAREHLTRAQLRRHLDVLRRRLRQLWPQHEWFVQVEFQRRGALHANLLIKGVSVDEAQLWHERITQLWCSRVDALPVGQWTGVVNDGVGALLYISKMLAHGLKAEQAPPIGWKGHRTSQTRGYLVRPASVMRQEARRSLRTRSTLSRVIDECPDRSAQEVEAIVGDLLQEQDERWWGLIIARDAEQAESLVQRGRIDFEGTSRESFSGCDTPPAQPCLAARVLVAL